MGMGVWFRAVRRKRKAETAADSLFSNSQNGTLFWDRYPKRPKKVRETPSDKSTAELKEENALLKAKLASTERDREMVKFPGEPC